MMAIRQTEISTENGVGYEQEDLIHSLEKQPAERTRLDYDTIVEALSQFPAFQVLEEKMIYSIIPCSHFEVVGRGDELGKAAKKLKRKISWQRNESKVRDSYFRSTSLRQKRETTWYLLLEGSMLYETERMKRGAVFEVSKETMNGHSYRWGKKSKSLQVPIATTDCILIRFTYLPQEVKESGHTHKSPLSSHLETVVLERDGAPSKFTKTGVRLSNSFSLENFYPTGRGGRVRNQSSDKLNSPLTNSAESELKEPVLTLTGPSPQKKTQGSNHSGSVLSPSGTEESTGQTFPFGGSPSPTVPRHSQCSVGSESAHSQNSSTDFSLTSDTGANPTNGAERKKSDAKPCHEVTNYSIDKYLPEFIVETISKSPQERTEEEVSNASFCLKNAPAFTPFSDPIRWRICSKMRHKTVPSVGTVVLKQGELIESWYVILTGTIEVFVDGQSPFKLQIGSSFGIGANLSPLTCRGNMLTAEPNCTFGYLPIEQLRAILDESQQKRVTQFEGEKPVSVMELRQGQGGHYGYFILQGSPDSLLTHLMETSIDESYIEDFLLTYRVFLPQPSGLSYRIEHWFSIPKYSMKAVQILLVWLRNHYTDFESSSEMQDFLDNFIQLLKESGREMSGYADSIRELRAIKAPVRLLKISGLRESNSPIAIGGGAEVGFPIFITRVHKSRLTNNLFLQGDQVVSINGKSCEGKTSNWARKLLFSGLELEVGMKHSREIFDKFMSQPRDFHATGFSTPINPSSPDLSSLNCESDSPASARFRRSPVNLFKRSFRLKNTGREDGPKTEVPLEKKLDRFLKRRGSLPKNFVSKTTTKFQQDRSKPLKTERSATITPDSEIFVDDELLGPGCSGRRSTLSDCNSPLQEGSSTLCPTASNSGISLKTHVIKLYYADHSFRFIPITLLTRACDLIQLALQEYNADSATFYTSQDQHNLCVATIDSNGNAKTSILPPTASNIPSRYDLASRFYIKPAFIVGNICPIEIAKEMLQESSDLVKIASLNVERLAAKLTLRDSTKFKAIDPTEYISDLLKCYSPNNNKRLQDFIDLSNAERWWVCTEVVNERSLTERVRIIKTFIRLANLCRNLNNFNAMFSIISGLDHGSVNRLKTTWDRVPNKYKRSLNDLKTYINPMRNMGEYRTLVKSVSLTGAPCIPMFPIVQKDLTVIHMSNNTNVDGMVNFDKLRILAGKVQSLNTLCPKPYQSIDQDVLTPLSPANSLHSNNILLNSKSFPLNSSPIKRHRKSSTFNHNPEYKMRYEDELMDLCIDHYISHLDSRIISDEVQLEVLSQLCEFTLTGSRRVGQQKRTTSLSRISSFSVKAGSSTQLVIPEKRSLSSTRSVELLSK